MTNKLKPALIGGGALGLFLVLTILIAAIPLPIVRTVGCCNCLWPIGAGLLATMLYVKGSPVPATILDGTIVGALSGVIGGVIYLIIGLPVFFFVNGVEMLNAQVRQFDPNFPLAGGVLLVIAFIIWFMIFVVLATIGGLIGVPLFEKRKESINPPPAPPNMGGSPPGTFGAGV